jgi:ParB family chromosome partitioning protein
MTQAAATQGKKVTEKRVIYLERTDAHPLNREFHTEGVEWEEFVQSVAENGVIYPPLLRYMADGRYEILVGHRRIRAARSLGIEKIECLVRKLTDREALEILLVENLQRENPDPVEEAKLVAEMAKLKMTPEEIAQRVSRSVEWVTTRQGMLDLGPEVLAAVKLPKEDERHLGIGVVQIMLQLEPEDWPKAVQMVLHPEFKLGALNMREATDVLRTQLLEPRKKQLEWEKGAEKMGKAWRKRLGALLSKGEKQSLVVRVVKMDEEVKARRRAEDALADEPTADLQEIPSGALWLHLAVKHEQTIYIVPAENEGGSEAVVNESLLKLAEQSAEEHGLVTWLSSKRRPAAPVEPGDVGDEEEDAGVNTSGPSGDDGRVDDALHMLEGQGERSYQEEEKVETVIEQRMDSAAWVNLMPVRALKEWAEKANADRKTVQGWDLRYPENAPPWITSIMLDPDDVIEAMDWFLSLNSKCGG